MSAKVIPCSVRGGGVKCSIHSHSWIYGSMMYSNDRIVQNIATAATSERILDTM